MKLAREAAERLANSRVDQPAESWPEVGGRPLVKISCAAAELIATRQFSNVTIGPVQVTRFVPDGTDEEIKAAIHATQALCEAAVAEDRETVHLLTRAAQE